jgi:hypothetical protein
LAGEQLLCCEQQSFSTARLEFQFGLANLGLGITCTHLSVVDGKLDLAVFRSDLADRPLNDGLKDGIDSGSLDGLLDRALDLLVGDFCDVGLFGV